MAKKTLTLGEEAARYMATCMGMPDSTSDQEQNFILGHLHTFAARMLTKRTRAERKAERELQRLGK